MQEIQTKVLERAIAMLKALPVQFAIITDGGAQFGELTVVVPKQRKTHVKSGIKFRPMYIEQASKILPGAEVHVFTPPAGIDPNMYRGALCGYCSPAWGKGTYSTEVKLDGTIHLMRWE